MMTRRRGWTLGLAGLAALLAAGVGAAVTAQERATEAPVVWGAFTFGKTHAVMRELRSDLEAILGGFLTGDTDAIASRADAIAEGMAKVGETIPADPASEQDPVWKQAREIVEHARRMQLAAHEGRPHEAYTHYVQMVNHCIACHQEQRVWGAFSKARGRLKDLAP